MIAKKAPRRKGSKSSFGDLAKYIMRDEKTNEEVDDLSIYDITEELRSREVNMAGLILVPCLLRKEQRRRDGTRGQKQIRLTIL